MNSVVLTIRLVNRFKVGLEFTTLGNKIGDQIKQTCVEYKFKTYYVKWIKRKIPIILGFVLRHRLEVDGKLFTSFINCW